MMRMLLLLMIAFTSISAFAAPQAISLNKKITTISTYDASENSAVIVFSPAQDSGQNCTDPRQDAVKIDLSVESGGRMLSTALAAAAAGKDAGFGVNGCLGGNLPKVYRVDVAF